MLTEHTHKFSYRPQFSNGRFLPVGYSQCEICGSIKTPVGDIINVQSL